VTDISAMREWAREQGYPVGVRGRLSLEVRLAYAAEHGGETTVHAGGGLWTCPRCARQWSGLAQCHCTVCHRHFSTVALFDRHRAGHGRTTCTDPADHPNIYKPSVNHLGTTWVGAGENPFSAQTVAPGSAR
jgi:hypothetical protein